MAGRPPNCHALLEDPLGPTLLPPRSVSQPPLTFYKSFVTETDITVM